MSAHIPPDPASATPLTPVQKREIETLLKQDGVKYQPKDLQSMASLKQLLHSQGRDDEFLKVMHVARSFSREGMKMPEGKMQSEPKSMLSLHPQVERKLHLALAKAFGEEHATEHLEGFEHFLKSELPKEELQHLTPQLLAKHLERYMTQHHIPQTEAHTFITETFSEEGSGGLGSASSGGAETE